MRGRASSAVGGRCAARVSSSRNIDIRRWRGDNGLASAYAAFEALVKASVPRHQSKTHGRLELDEKYYCDKVLETNYLACAV